MNDLLLGALLTLVVSLIAGFAGVRFQASREHQLWVREKRYENIVRVIKLASRGQWEQTHGDKIREVQKAAADLVVPELRRGARAKLTAQVHQIQHEVVELDALKPRYLDLLEAVRELQMVCPPKLSSLGNALVMRAIEEQDATSPAFLRALDDFADAAQEILKTR